MRQLPFILVLVLSSGLLLWNFSRYDEVHAAEREHRETSVAEVELSTPVETRPLEPDRAAFARAVGEAPAPSELLGAERVSDGTTRVAIGAPEPEVFEGPPLPPPPEPEEEVDFGDADIERVLLRGPDGRIRAEGVTVDGKKHGRWTEWWRADQRLSEGTYLLGKRQGAWTYWHENGEVKERGAYKDDLPDGPWSWNYADGSLRLALSYTDGKSHGRMQEWAEDGSLMREGSFVDGEPDGRWVESHPDGSPRSETHYVGGLRHGSHRAWYTDGQLKEQGEYRSGLREGRWVFYDSEGRADPVRTGYYELGRRHGP